MWPVRAALLSLLEGSRVSIIEQAAQRLEQLRRAGVGPDSIARPVPEVQGEPAPGVLTASASPGRAGNSAWSQIAATYAHVDLDLARLAANGILTPNVPRSKLADEYRAAKRGLLVNVRNESAAPVKRANCIMITSSVPGEGKTFTAVNLAMSLAMEMDTSVLLIDADVMRPSVLGRLGLPPGRGLLDLLTDPALKPQDVILNTNLDKLFLLPAGPASGRATELLASGAMARLVESLGAQDAGRILLFDSPPLLAAPETRALAAHVGQIVVVIEAGRTPQHTVAAALDLVKDSPVVMTLLNKTRGGAGAPYGYGAYGGYGYGAS
jgi:protein-tyrosine kinase